MVAQVELNLHQVLLQELMVILLLLEEFQVLVVAVEKIQTQVQQGQEALVVEHLVLLQELEDQETLLQ